MVKADSTLPPEHPDSYNNLTPRLARETPGCYFPDQHCNRENNAAHYHSTGPEIWEQMEGRIDYFVAGAGTGGTIGGIGRYLKEQDPKIRSSPSTSSGSSSTTISEGGRISARPLPLRGARRRVPDSHHGLRDPGRHPPGHRPGAFRLARELVRTEGILAGGSSGAAVHGVLTIARSLDRPARIVTVFPDGASRYLSTIFNDDWMKSIGPGGPPPAASLRRGLTSELRGVDFFRRSVRRRRWNSPFLGAGAESAAPPESADRAAGRAVAERFSPFSPGRVLADPAPRGSC